MNSRQIEQIAVNAVKDIFLHMMNLQLFIIQIFLIEQQMIC